MEGRGISHRQRANSVLGRDEAVDILLLRDMSSSRSGMRFYAAKALAIGCNGP